MRIRVINPVTETVLSRDILPPLPDFVKAELDWVKEGLPSIECRYDDAVSVPALLERVKRAAREGVDAIVINCFMDPGLKTARELVHTPVAGPAEGRNGICLNSSFQRETGNKGSIPRPMGLRRLVPNSSQSSSDGRGGNVTPILRSTTTPKSKSNVGSREGKGGWDAAIERP